MNSSSRLLILLFVFVGVIVAMMDCAKRVEKRHVHPAVHSPADTTQAPAPAP